MSALSNNNNNNNKNWLYLGFYSGLQRATVIAFGMLTTMALAHKAITPAEMGVWSLFLIIAAFVEILRHGLLRNSVIKYLSTCTNDNKPLVLCSGLLLNTAITATIAGLLFLGAKTIAGLTNAPHLESMIYWNNLALLMLIPFSHVEWLMLAKVEFKGLFWTYVVRQSVTLLLILALLAFDRKVTLDMLVVFYAAGIGAGALFGFFYNRSHFKMQLRFSPLWVRNLWNFGKYTFGTGLSNLVFRSTDTFAVSNLLFSPALVAQQGIALRVFNLADIPSQMIGDVLFPKSANLEPTDKSKIAFYYEKSVGVSLALILPAILLALLFPQTLILILAGPEYMGAVPYLRMLMFASIFLCFLKQFGTIIDSTGNVKINFLFTTGIAVINLFTCFFFISRFQLVGAAYGLLTTHLLAFIVSQTILYNRYGIRFFNSFGYAVRFYPEVGKMISQKFFTKMVPQ